MNLKYKHVQQQIVQDPGDVRCAQDPPIAEGMFVLAHMLCIRLLRVVYMKLGCSENSFWHSDVPSNVTVSAEHTPLVIS